MKKLLMKMALVATILVPLIWAVPSRAEVVGNDPIPRIYLDPYFSFTGFSYNNITVIDTVHRIPVNGKVTDFQYYAANTSPFYFILVARVAGRLTVQWVSERITPTETNHNPYTYTLAVTEQVPVQSGWYIGVYLMSDSANTQGSSTIPFDFDQSGSSGYIPCLYNLPPPTVGRDVGSGILSSRSYSFRATVVPDTPQSGDTVDVTIVKYLDGVHATDAADSAGVNSFPIIAFWGKDNPSSASDHFYLGHAGYNTPNHYEAKSPVMPIGSFYSVAEDTISTNAVGSSCDVQFPFSRLIGYTTGDSIDTAKIATPIPGAPAPSWTNIASNQYVIVWNETCRYAKVTVVKYLDGKHADDTSAQSNSFPMKESYGSGSITFALGPSGVNTTNSYEAESRTMTSGAFYSVEEDTSTSTVGNSCANGQFSQLLGYTTGDSIGAAERATRTITAPNLTNIARNQYVIVWNKTCKPVNVTVVKYLDGNKADATTAQSNSFPMKSSWSAANGSGSGTFALGPAGVPYEAQSVAMTSGASYSISEDTSTSAVGNSCANGQFSQLLGYTAGDTLDKAITAARTTSAPNLTNITSNKYVIVWNGICQAVPPDNDDDCDHDDNGHHYGNDKGDNHKSKDKCEHDDNGHHYGNDKGDNHQPSKDKDRDDGKKGKDGGKR